MEDKDQWELSDSVEMLDSQTTLLNDRKITIEYLYSRDNFSRKSLELDTITHRAWKTLTDAEKDIFFMRVVQGLTFNKIGYFTGDSRQAARSCFFRACRKFK